MTASRFVSACRKLATAALGATAGGCSGVQSAFNPGGPQAGLIARESGWLLGMGAVVFAVTLSALVYAVLHRRRPADAQSANPGIVRWVSAALAVAIVVLLTNVVVDMRTGRALADLPERARAGALTVAVTGHQWWWEIEYEHADPRRRLTTANELHIPVGRPVKIELRSADVIHSFWVPGLHGKRDLIPGRSRALWIQADRAGVFRGQCAEFCGDQHANMALLVIATAPEDFARWYAAELLPARAPAGAAARAGQRVFLANACVLCHTIRGTPAGGRVAPDLTHLASRRSLAAGTLPNTPPHRRAWVLDPQGIKPGVRMPALALPARDAAALFAYLDGLQ